MTANQPTSFIPSKQIKRALLKDKKRTGRTVTYLVNQILMKHYFPDHKRWRSVDFAELDVTVNK